jgi:site-specific DNA-methyltransferase (adenine-specific)
LGKIRKPFVDLIFADPPFNIGYKYDVYEDRRAYDDYHAWTRQWMEECARVLKPSGCFWIAIGDDYAAEVRMLGRELGLHLRNWVIWHYTFGQQTKAKFARSHTHLFYFVKDPTDFTFNDEAVRTFSDRQRVYKDKRANKAGKIPDDSWNEFPRVCGTFGEREGWHPCQMPETVLMRIILACSSPKDIVFDPFAGSGTTLAVAKKLSRKYVGVEVSADYAKRIRARLAAIRSMAAEEKAFGRWCPQHVEQLQMLYLTAAVATDSLFANTALLAGLTQHLNWRLRHSGSKHSYKAAQVWLKLEQLRKELRLGQIRVHARESATGEARSLKVEPTLFPK